MRSPGIAPRLTSSAKTPIAIRSAGHRMRPLIASPCRDSRGGLRRSSDRGDDGEELRALPARGLDQLGSRDRGLRGAALQEVRARHALQVVAGRGEHPLFEALALLTRETREPVGGLPAALDVWRLERVDVTASAEDRLFQRL